MINFILGLFIGGITGVSVMCFLQVGKHNEIIEDCEIEK